MLLHWNQSESVVSSLYVSITRFPPHTKHISTTSQKLQRIYSNARQSLYGTMQFVVKTLYSTSLHHNYLFFFQIYVVTWHCVPEQFVVNKFSYKYRPLDTTCLMELGLKQCFSQISACVCVCELSAKRPLSAPHHSDEELALHVLQSYDFNRPLWVG